MGEPAVKATKKGLISTTSEFRDYKTGDPVTCLSQGEKMLWYILRWDDDVDYIDTQVPLDNAKVDKIIAEMEESPTYIPDPVVEDNREPLSTDLVAHLANGELRAFQVKASPRDIESFHASRRLYIEDLYWQSQSVPWKIIFKSDINIVYFQNIERVIRYYDPSSVHDSVSYLQHLIATKQLLINDMKSELVDWKSLAEREGIRYEGNGNN